MKRLFMLSLFVLLAKTGAADFQSVETKAVQASATPTVTVPEEPPQATTHVTTVPVAGMQNAPPTTILTRLVFTDERGALVGWIDWSQGKMKFRGDFDPAAKVFFKKFLKRYVDSACREARLK